MLMALASWRRAPSVPVTATRSDPAKSTSLIVDVEEDGTVFIASVDADGGLQAKAEVEALEPKPGDSCCPGARRQGLELLLRLPRQYRLLLAIVQILLGQLLLGLLQLL